MDRKQLSMFKEWFADAFPDCKDYLELTYFDAEQNTFLSKCSYNPDSGNAAKVLRTVLGSWQHQQAKMEELQTQLSLQRQRVKAFEEELTSSRNYGDELQKRVDAALAVLTEYYTGSYDESPDLVVDIEQALKGGQV